MIDVETCSTANAGVASDKRRENWVINLASGSNGKFHSAFYFSLSVNLESSFLLLYSFNPSLTPTRSLCINIFQAPISDL